MNQPNVQAMMRVLLLEQGISEFGKQLSFFALPVIAVVILGASVFDVGLLATVTASAALAGGVVSARTVTTLSLYSRTWLPVVCTSLALLVVFLGGMSEWFRIEFIYAAGAVAGLCAPMLRVSYLTAVKRTISENEILAFNGRANLIQAVVSVAAPTLVGVATAGGLSPLFLILVNIATLLFTAVVLHWIIGHAKSDSDGTRTDSPSANDHGAATALDVRLRNQTLFGIGCETLWVFCRTGVGAVVVVYILDYLGRTEFSVGLVMTAGGIGFVAGAALSSLGSKTAPLLRNVVFFCSALCGLLLLVTFVEENVAFFAIACFSAFSAIGYIVLDVAMTSWRQVALREKDFMVFSSWSETSTTAARLASGAVSGLLGHYVGLHWLLIWMGVIFLFMTIVLVLVLGKTGLLVSCEEGRKK